MKVSSLVARVGKLKVDLHDIVSTLKSVHGKYKNYNLTDIQKDEMIKEMLNDGRCSVKVLVSTYIELKNELDILLDKDIDFVSDGGTCINGKSSD